MTQRNTRRTIKDLDKVSPELIIAAARGLRFYSKTNFRKINKYTPFDLDSC